MSACVEVQRCTMNPPPPTPSLCDEKDNQPLTLKPIFQLVLKIVFLYHIEMDIMIIHVMFLSDLMMKSLLFCVSVFAAGKSTVIHDTAVLCSDKGRYEKISGSYTHYIGDQRHTEWKRTLFTSYCTLKYCLSMTHYLGHADSWTSSMQCTVYSVSCTISLFY